MAGRIVPARSVKIPYPTWGLARISRFFFSEDFLLLRDYISFSIGDKKIFIDFFFSIGRGILSSNRL